MERKVKLLHLKHVKLAKRNFRGDKTVPYNDRGYRNALVVINEEHANEAGYDTLVDFVETLKEDGWSVNWFKQRDPDDAPSAFIKVRAEYGDRRNSNIIRTTGRRKELLTEDTVGTIDYSEIYDVDVILRLKPWEYNGRNGVSTIIQSMDVKVVEDEIMSSYYDDINDESEEGVPF